MIFLLQPSTRHEKSDLQFFKTCPYKRQLKDKFSLTTSAFFLGKDLLKNASQFINLCLLEQNKGLVGLLSSKLLGPS